MRLEIFADRIDCDPSITIYHVELEDGMGTWKETFGSGNELKIWMDGVKASWCLATNGYLHLPAELPKPGERLAVVGVRGSR